MGIMLKGICMLVYVYVVCVRMCMFAFTHVYVHTTLVLNDLFSCYTIIRNSVSLSYFVIYAILSM